MSGDTKALGYYDHELVGDVADIADDSATRRAPVIKPDNNRAVNIQAKVTRARLEREKQQKKIAAKARAEAKAVSGVSIFAIAGAIVVAVLMVFVVLAQISYNESARETVRLRNTLMQLAEQHSVLELAYVSSVDINEIERFARDELGMSRPDVEQMIFVSTTMRDSAVVIHPEIDTGNYGFVSFLRSLLEHFN